MDNSSVYIINRIIHGRLELSRRYFFNVRELYFSFSRLASLSFFAFILLFSCSSKDSSLVLSRHFAVSFWASLPLFFSPHFSFFFTKSLFASYQAEKILTPLFPFCFYRKPRACCPPLSSTIVRISDLTKNVFSQSFAFLIGWLCISYQFYAWLCMK